MAIRILCVLLLLFITPGCWDLREAEQTGIILGLGIDQTRDGKIALIYQAVRPQQSGSGGSGSSGGEKSTNFYNRYVVGDTLFDAVRNLSLQSPKQVFFSHLQVIIISENLAKKGLLNVLDALERNPEVRRNTWLLVARGDLQEVMESGAILQEPPAQAMADIIKNRDRNSKYAISRLGDFLEMMDHSDVEAFTAGVATFKGIMKNRNQISIQGLESEQANELKIIDTAVFREDRLVGWLDPTESRGFLWIRGEVKQGVINLNNENKKTAVEILGASSKVKPKIENGRLVMQVKIKMDGSLGEVPPGINILDNKSFKRIEQDLSSAIKREVLAAVNKTQELNTDILEFGHAVHTKYPREWNTWLAKEWPEVFKDLEVEVEVDSNIIRIGLITTSVNPGRGQK